MILATILAASLAVLAVAFWVLWAFGITVLTFAFSLLKLLWPVIVIGFAVWAIYALLF